METKFKQSDSGNTTSNARKSYLARHKISLGIGVVVIALVAGGAYLAYNQLKLSAADKLSLQIGRETQSLSRVNNWGWADVTADFVNDYVQAKYFGDKRTDVGYKSVHAVAGLEGQIKYSFPSTQPGFDPLVCGSEAPTAVKYLSLPGGHVDAAVVAAFSYANNKQPNLVQYSLRLDRSKNAEKGEWKVIRIACLSYESQATKPYVSSLDANAIKTHTTDPKINYLTRNDRTFQAVK